MMNTKKFRGQLVSRDNTRVVLGASKKQDTFVICEECGELVKFEDAGATENGHVCNDCIEAYNYHECRECGNLEREDDMRYDTVNENYMCETCFDDGGYFKCDECGEIVDDYQIVCVNDGDYIVCETCADDNYYQCEDCGKWFTREKISLEGKDDKYICEDCVDKWTTCDDCNELIHLDYAYRDNDGYCYCETCYYENGHETSECINDYSYKPEAEFFGETEEGLYFGLELEIDGGSNLSDTAERIDYELDMCYLKEDGSLHGGFEIVTHPMSLEYALEQKETFRSAFTIAVDNDFKSHDSENCGYHIHFSRDFYGEEDAQDLNTAKLMLLVDTIWDDLVTFSRREKAELDRWAKRYSMKKTTEKEVIEESKGVSGRYYAVNTQNDDTIEIRLFKGTLNIDTFTATLQFTNNLVRIAKETSLNDIRQLTIKDVIDYNHFEELTAYATIRGLL